MKKNTKMFLAFIVCALMLFAGMTVSSVGVYAAAKTQGTIDLNKKALIIPKGKTQKIRNKRLTMVKDRRYQVKAKFGNTVVKSQGIWKSSKPAVVTISKSGLITAKAPGIATIEVIYSGKTQSLKVKVIASHKHRWKTIIKATCGAKGKKLCKNCGAIGSTVMTKMHRFEVTKKATCRKTGIKTCSVCGTTRDIAKTKHIYETKTSYYIEGRGKSFSESTAFCSGCDADMTYWTQDQIAKHRTDLDGVIAGTSNFGCFGSSIYGVVGETRYHKYVKEKITYKNCKNCGADKIGSHTSIDLYECDKYGYQIPDGTDPWALYNFENYCKEHCTFKHICGDKHKDTNTVNTMAETKATVVESQDVIAGVSDADVNTDNANVSVSDNEVISNCTIVIK